MLFLFLLQMELNEGSLRLPLALGSLNTATMPCAEPDGLKQSLNTVTINCTPSVPTQIP